MANPLITSSTRPAKRPPRVGLRRATKRPVAGSPAQPGSPTLERARPLPGGRAVVGAFLVTAAAVGVFAAYRSASSGPTSPVVIAAVDIPAGHRIEGRELRVERAELPPSVTANVFATTADLDGSVTLSPLRAGDLVQRSAVLVGQGETPGQREVSFAVDRERALDGDLQKGERVDVLATFGSNDGAYTNVVARDVALLNVDSGGKSNGIGNSTKLTVTVALASGDDVLRLAHATQVAPITLVRTTRGQGTDPGTLDTYRAPGGTKPPSGPNTTSPGGRG
ncbi:MAG: Flp pilus assembly protein CpaB [Actinobacteria bacterium]|nr:Flp pilus assembly protein CpaB [Actinomycetota bacterium]